MALSVHSTHHIDPELDPQLKQVADGIPMAADHHRFALGGVGLLEDRGDIPVVVTGQLHQALLAVVRLQAVPAGEAGAPRGLRVRPGDRVNRPS